MSISSPSKRLRNIYSDYLRHELKILDERLNLTTKNSIYTAKATSSSIDISQSVDNMSTVSSLTNETKGCYNALRLSIQLQVFSDDEISLIVNGIKDFIQQGKYKTQELDRYWYDRHLFVEPYPQQILDMIRAKLVVLYNVGFLETVNESIKILRSYIVVYDPFYYECTNAKDCDGGMQFHRDGSEGSLVETIVFTLKSFNCQGAELLYYNTPDGKQHRGIDPVRFQPENNSAYLLPGSLVKHGVTPIKDGHRYSLVVLLESKYNCSAGQIKWWNRHMRNCCINCKTMHKLYSKYAN